MKSYRKTLWMVVLCLALVGLRPPPSYAENWQQRVRGLAKGGAVMVADAAGHTLLAVNPDNPLVPASTLKVVTAAAALSALGPDYRFVTEFRLTSEGDLYAVGRGDPYLISEELDAIARALKARGLLQVRHIFLDPGFFAPGLVLHGTSRSLNPYDAFNGALCVNFNTIFVHVGATGTVTSAEPQTPLTDLARDMALQSGVRGDVRINLAESPDKCLLYAGELLKAFLVQNGVPVTGRIEPASRPADAVPLFYRHVSRKNLSWLLSQVFEYSNNFMANQIFLTMGAELYGPPATADKSRRVMADYLAARGLPDLHIEEGSGLSRRTTMAAAQMVKVLNHFSGYRDLLTAKGRVRYKTGTLSDVRSMVGYLLPDVGPPLSFVIFLNGTGVDARARERILALLEENLL